ncbi:unknown protein [Microcystis aeruginosa NIES-843]|uniref:Uncharacterized protein n=1 Tax=Microcystis aeruginosa (strain NIES-843 / IAM M-2473) TaxID=449447 RepID=B0JX20_MICAN|nr:unknown protein [Microcystis aeruginosa NIES-843]
MTFLINIFLWLLSGLLKYQPSTEQNPPFACIYLSGVVVLTILSRTVIFLDLPHTEILKN